MGLAACALVAGGCVALTGIGDLEVENGASSPEAGPAGTLPDGTTGAGDVAVIPPSTDANAATDAGHADEPPESGAPDTGAPDTGSGATVRVLCVSKTCTDGAGCCNVPFVSTTCSGSAECAGESFYACDGNEDCKNGQVCCITWQPLGLSGGSTCATTCSSSSAAPGGGGAGIGCTNDSTVCSDGSTCKAAPGAPVGILACQ